MPALLYSTVPELINSALYPKPSSEFGHRPYFDEATDSEMIADVFQRRLINIPPQIKHLLPRSVSQKVPSFLFFRNDFLMFIAFTNDKVARGSLKRHKRGEEPFSQLLISPSYPTPVFKLAGKDITMTGAGLTLELSQFTAGFKVGADVSLVCENLIMKPFEQASYKIDLLFILGFGAEINSASWIDHLEILTASYISRLPRSAELRKSLKSS